MNARRALAVARAEWLLNRRDLRSLAVIIFLPPLLIVLYGFGLNFEPRNLSLAVQDLDRSRLSRAIVRRLVGSGYFELSSLLLSDADMADLLRSGRSLAVLIIPPTFTKDLASGRRATMGLVIDGSDPQTAGTALGYLQKFITRLAGEQLAVWARRRGMHLALPPIDVHVRVLYNPSFDTATFIVPGLIGVVMALMAALLTSTCVVREREIGTIEALLSSPIRPAEIIVGKLTPYAVFSMIDIGLLVAAGWGVFGVRPRGSLLEFFFISALFLLACLSTGLLISSKAGSQRTAIVGGIMALMLPTVMLSGFVFPVANMPKPLQVISMLLPATHYIALSRALYLRGTSILMYPTTLAALVVLTLALFTLAVKAFRARL